ncbi:MAG TPA: hypothetical protein VN522_11680 [Solirubrobacterales bacterium]|nr:hypothetical protein [Solirubrobacterales bacterium]
MSRTASTGFDPEPLPPVLEDDRLLDLPLDFAAGPLLDLLADLLDPAAGLDLLVELDLLDLELPPEPDLAEAELFFV